MNEPKLAYRNELLLVRLPTCLHTSLQILPTTAVLFFYTGLTPRTPRTVYRYFRAYPFFTLSSFYVFHFLVVVSVR